MKRKILSILALFSCLVLLVVFFSSNKESVQKNKKEQHHLELAQNKKVLKEITYDSSCQSATEANLDYAVEHCEAIVEGVISDINYETHDGLAWTCLSLDVTKTVKGKVNDKSIRVYVLGGYISYDEYYDYYFEEKKEESKPDSFIKATESPINNCYSIGKSITAMLVSSPDNSPFEDGAYEGICGNYSIYIHENNQYFTYNIDNQKEVKKQKDFMESISKK